jgi:hypothetical protein
VLTIANPVETIKVLHRIVAKGNRSHLISEAVLHDVESTAKGNLAKRLKAGAPGQCRKGPVLNQIRSVERRRSKLRPDDSKREKLAGPAAVTKYNKWIVATGRILN